MSTAIRKSGWAVLFSPGWRPPVFQAGGRVFSRRAGLGRQWDHPLACEGLGEPVRVALGQHQVGVVQQPKARRFVDSWLPAMRNPNVVVALGFGAGRVRVKSPRAAFGMGRLDVVHGGFRCEAEDAHEMDGVSGVLGLVQDPVLAEL